MTYKELAEKILAMSEEKQGNDVTILTLDSEEILPTIDFVTSWGSVGDVEDMNPEYYSQGVDIADGALDEGHPYLSIAF